MGRTHSAIAHRKDALDLCRTSANTIEPAAIAVAIAGVLNAALSDPEARSIVLTRDEALLTLGIVEGVVDQLDRHAR